MKTRVLYRAYAVVLGVVVVLLVVISLDNTPPADVTDLHVKAMMRINNKYGRSTYDWKPSKSWDVAGYTYRIAKTSEEITSKPRIDIGNITSIVLTNEVGLYYTVEVDAYDYLGNATYMGRNDKRCIQSKLRHLIGIIEKKFRQKTTERVPNKASESSVIPASEKMLPTTRSGCCRSVSA